MKRLTERKFGGIVSKREEETGISCSSFCNDCSQGTGNCKYVKAMVEKLAEYEDLEEQGLLLKLQCKRGDTVYFIKSAFSIAAFPIDAKVVSINGVDCDNDVMYSTITNYNKIERRFKSSDIGKTVFLTQAEAEEALEVAVK